MAKDNSISANHVLAFLIGATIGVGTGLLVAPKSGQELRSDISGKAKETKDKVAGKIDSGKETAKSKLSNVLSKTQTVASESSRAAGQVKKRIQEES